MLKGLRPSWGMGGQSVLSVFFLAKSRFTWYYLYYGLQPDGLKMGTPLYQVYIQQAAVRSRYPDRTAVQKGDAVRIEPRPLSPTTCRLCARSSRTLFRPQASGDGSRMQGVLGEYRASCRLSFNRAGSNSDSQQQYEEVVDNS